MVRWLWVFGVVERAVLTVGRRDVVTTQNSSTVSAGAATSAAVPSANDLDEEEDEKPSAPQPNGSPSKS